LLKPEFWEPCQHCAWREQCFIYFNVSALADPASGPPVRERLRTLFEVVHLRRQLHITMRDMRSALSWLLFRDHSCDDVARLLSAHVSPIERLSRLYYDAYAAEGSPPEGRVDDRLVGLLRQIDPAQVANPTIDRTLHFQGLANLTRLAFETRSLLAELALEDWRLAGGWEAAQEPQVAGQIQARHAILRRIAYFERRDNGWLEMLPYKNLAEFRQVTQSPEADQEWLKVRLVQGISLAEGAYHQELAQRFVCLRAGQTTKATIKSFRLFPYSDFRLQVPRARGGHYLEYTPDQIIFYHAPQQTGSQAVAQGRRAELVISLDLLELLTQIREGFTPSLDDIQGFFINFVVFKNALAHLPYRQVVLTRDDRQFYELSLGDRAVVSLRPWSAERIVADETVA
jgi:hypothetical protein